MFKTTNTTIRLFISFIILAAICTTYLGTRATSSAAAKTNTRERAAKALKMSPHLRGGKHEAGEKVRVLVELNGQASGRLNTFLSRNGLRLRRQLQKLRTISLDLPYNKVAELSSYPEVFHVSINSQVSVSIIFSA